MAINPILVSIKQASDLPSAIPTNSGEFLFFEDNTLQKSSMSDIYDRVASGIKGVATTSTVPAATGFERWLVHEEGTYTNFSGIVVTDADLDVVNGVANNRVILEVSEGVATKRVERVMGPQPDPAIVNNNTYNLDPAQIVPSEALYNDTPETLAGDVLKRVDKITGEDVNYRETVVWRDGTIMTDAKADGVIFIKKSGKFYKREYTGNIQLKWFGAKGDGVTNDTVSINSAVDFLRDADVLEIPSGMRFKTDGVSIVNKNKISIIGGGELVSNGISVRVLKIENCKDIKVNDITINGNSNSLVGIDIRDNCESIDINKVSIKDVGGANSTVIGISLRNGCKNININQTKINNIISTNNSSGIAIQRFDGFEPCQNIMVDNCIIDNIQPVADSDGIKVIQLFTDGSEGYDTYLTVKNSKFINCAKRAIKTQGKHILVEDCYMEGGMGYAGVDFQAGYGILRRSKMFIDGEHYAGVFVGGPNCEIDGNRIEVTGAIVSTSGSAVRIDSMSTTSQDMGSLKIKNNTLKNTQRLLNFDGGDTFGTIEITDNTFDGFKHQYGTNLFPKCKQLFFNRNTIKNTPTPYSYFWFVTTAIDDAFLTTFEVIANTINGSIFSKASIMASNLPRVADIRVNTSNLKFDGTVKTIFASTIPAATTGTTGNLFIQSKKGDIVKNTNPTTLTDLAGTYYIDSWLCVQDSVLTDTTWSVGTWVARKVYQNAIPAATIGAVGLVNQAASVPNVAAADATDLATALTLVNELKAKLNAKLGADRTAGQQAT